MGLGGKKGRVEQVPNLLVEWTGWGFTTYPFEWVQESLSMWSRARWVDRITDTNRRKLGITPEPISGLINLQRCETGDSIGLFACDFGLLIQKKLLKIIKMVAMTLPHNTDL